jgi:orotate phosphoribosyltransferase-like protein
MVLTDFQKSKIVELRGLGYTEADVAKKLKLSHGQVTYFLNKINEDAVKKGDDTVYLKVMSAGLGPKLLRAFEQLMKHSK